jgi:serine O-acetyltransferase
MFDNVREDMRRKAAWYEWPDNARSILRMMLSEGSAAQVYYRAMRWCQERGFGLGSLFFYRLNANVSKTVIGRGAQIGPGFVILHSFGIVINTSVRAGRNLVIEHCVTIGAEKNQSPVIGDNVFIGAGAKVIGNVKVGSDVKIGANAVVTRDVPDGATAVGVPARVVRIYGKPPAESHSPLPGFDGAAEHPGDSERLIGAP